MSKNAEIIAEIISEEVGKLDKLVMKQSEFIQEFSNTIERAERISIKTDRLEEIIEHWNSLFDKQKQQIKALQSKQLIENRIHRVITYLLLATIIITVLTNKIK
ncbi:hypothetical protein LIT63_10225 [Flavobacterium psychrophilum]|uniref:hypothetical protein n=1 Tax=Flavobacterium psychrophilum TaxID=96345 RepID=UPI000B7C2731|nr:hypothetical protein [Flavobacterium psychrophilum]EKT4519669.1 hypothetical protein [Flavobacterium psychrophilum]MCB6000076.1 hypothetical protein [Flavobacterium psychrophilum]MCB6014965.1 hypothetical protein [Flavobacterium psychrophilum]MCB6022326.1 hypothetical protein [Flavobacterium psychrophilum]MCB6032225.1 hypothetical protein [Flavobacterium psychrophilum]